jgi:hypothetical protein
MVRLCLVRVLPYEELWSPAVQRLSPAEQFGVDWVEIQRRADFPQTDRQ